MYFSLVRSFFGGDLTICQILEPRNFTRSSYYEINEIVQASVTFSSPLCLVTPPAFSAVSPFYIVYMFNLQCQTFNSRV